MTKEKKRQRAIESAKRAGTMGNQDLFESARAWASCVVSQADEIEKLKAKLSAATPQEKQS